MNGAFFTMRSLVLIGSLMAGLGLGGTVAAAPPVAGPVAAAAKPAPPTTAPPKGATTASAQPAAAAPAAATSGEDSASQTYVLGPADVIEVSVLGRPDFTTKGRIAEDGTLSLPYLGSVKVSDMTANQLSEDLAKSLLHGGYYVNPIVKVEIVSFASRYVTVLGNVGTPGLVPVDRPYRLSEICLLYTSPSPRD